jgi:hypothetical protein
MKDENLKIVEYDVKVGMKMRSDTPAVCTHATDYDEITTTITITITTRTTILQFSFLCHLFKNRKNFLQSHPVKC